MKRLTLRGTCGLLVLAGAGSWSWADGGAVRALETDGPFQISAFTSPNPLVAGPADISVLVQDAATLAPVAEAEVDIVIAPRGRAAGAIACAATSEAATNKLFRACLVELEAGWYDVSVHCRLGERRGWVGFPMEVGPTGPRLAALWPWIAWPVVPIALVAAHEVLRARNSKRRAATAANTARQGRPQCLQ